MQSSEISFAVDANISKSLLKKGRKSSVSVEVPPVGACLKYLWTIGEWISAKSANQVAG